MQAENRKMLLRRKLSQEGLNVSDSEIHKQTSSKVRRLLQRSQGFNRQGRRLSISAGDLLEKSHEELVLLLIQLRRSQTRIVSSQEKCLVQIQTSQQMAHRSGQLLPEHVAHCELLQKELQELNRQREQTQPFMNLVDNMVKLGKPYKGQEPRTGQIPPPFTAFPKVAPLTQNLFFPSDVLLRIVKWLKGDQNSGESSMEECMFHLYDLNRSFCAETNMLVSLHQDKDMLESTLESVDRKLDDMGDNPVSVQKFKKQQTLLERELLRVRNLLAQTSQKIEDIAYESGRLEVHILSRKHQLHHLLKQVNPATLDVHACTRGELEVELALMERAVEEVAGQRQEVSSALERMRLEAHLRSAIHRGALQPDSPVKASPTGGEPLPFGVRAQVSDSRKSSLSISSYLVFNEDLPPYINAGPFITDSSPAESPSESSTHGLDFGHLPHKSVSDPYLPSEVTSADDRFRKFYGNTLGMPESELRSQVRERKKVTYDDHSLVWLVDDQRTPLSDENGEQSDVVFEDGNSNNQKRPTSLLLASRGQQGAPGFLSAHQQLFGPLRSPSSLSSETSPSSGPGQPPLLLPHLDVLGIRMPLKKTKRRHYTISGSQNVLEEMSSPRKSPGPRSKDDIDMERHLRMVNTPDIVRSTIKKSDIFDDKLIDRELGLPQKIVIPERYIEIEPEELSITEKLRRSQKAETIRKMLSETTTSTMYQDLGEKKAPTETLKKKLDEEKKHRSHLLALNHALAKEVMERSKMVAV